MILKAFPNSILSYPSGPVSLSPDDIPGYDSSAHTTPTGDIESYGWWRRKDGTPLYVGIDKGMQRIADTIRAEGPFDGVIGFSQGAAAAAMVASLLEGDERREAFRRAREQQEGPASKDEAERKMAFPQSWVEADGKAVQPPLKFAIVYSGFQAPLDYYSAFYEPKITTPVLHFIGSLDTVVEESRSRALVEACAGGEERVAVHAGGHFLPSQKVWLDAAVGFIRECVIGGQRPEEKLEESAADMDVPF